MRTPKLSDKEFAAIYEAEQDDRVRASKLGCSVAYMKLRWKKLNTASSQTPELVTDDSEADDDYPVIVTEHGTYTRSCITYSKGAEVKAKQQRETCSCNDTDYTPIKFVTTKMTEEEIDRETFIINKLKRSFGNVNQ
jgi:hypothetical protein